MKKYPEYKDSGIEWIGEIPDHWSLCKVKYVADIQSGEGTEADKLKDNGLYEVYGGNGILGLYENFNVDEQTIVIGRVGAKCGNVHLVHGKKWISDNALILKTNQNYPFIYYLVSSMKLNGLANQNAQPLITGTQIRNQIISIPEHREQQSIVKYLQKNTSQIDSLIEKKKRLIELLKEYRTAIINHAVTKGLDPNVKMKDSGIEWIGEIPEHWEVKRLKHVLRNIVEKAEEKEADFKVALENIESFTGQFIQGDSTFEGNGNIFKKGDVLFSKLRPYLCKVMLAPIDGVAVGELLILRTQSILDEKFMLYRMLSHGFISAVNSSTYGSKMPRSSWEYISNLRIPIPSRQEQSRIATYLQQAMSNINRVILKQNEVINYLQEYRTSLISDAVTGKIDVREEI